MTLRTLEGTYKQVVDEMHEHAREAYGYSYERVIFTNGCFDILHMGHLSVLAHCRELAGPKGAVVVGLNSDKSVKALKGSGRPIMNETERATMLAYLKTVDHVFIFEEETPLELIQALRPDVIVKGGDYVNQKVVGSELATVVCSNLLPDHSTTDIIQRIKENG